MVYEKTYAIYPKLWLKILSFLCGQRLQFLLRPDIWTQQEGGFRVPLVKDDVEPVKLLFIAHILRISRENKFYAPERGIHKILGFILGNPPYKTRVFDRWWKIEVAGGGYETLGFIKDLPTDELKMLGKIGSWIDSVVEQEIQLRNSTVSKSTEQPTLLN